MHTTGGNIKRTAELLGKSRPAVYRLLKKYQI
jgi:transcriptional regulator of acetoin/glycerol metabolism